jgi:hypothetical protein
MVADAGSGSAAIGDRDREIEIGGTIVSVGAGSIRKSGKAGKAEKLGLDQFNRSTWRLEDLEKKTANAHQASSNSPDSSGAQANAVAVPNARGLLKHGTG